MILSDPGSSDLTPHLSQLPTKIVTRQWTYPLSLHCRNAISFMRLVTRPCSQIAQMVGWSSAAIALSPSASPRPVSVTICSEGMCELLHTARELRSTLAPPLTPLDCLW